MSPASVHGIAHVQYMRESRMRVASAITTTIAWTSKTAPASSPPGTSAAEEDELALETEAAVSGCPVLGQWVAYL